MGLIGRVCPVAFIILWVSVLLVRASRRVGGRGTYGPQSSICSHAQGNIRLTASLNKRCPRVSIVM